MTNQTNASANDQAGSAIQTGPTDPNKMIGSTPVGEPTKVQEADYKAQYEELEKRFGTQGNELGEYRSFFEGIAPLLDKLDKSPDLVQAIIAGTVDENLAKAVVEGKVTVGEAKAITQAHEEVKKDLGKKEYEKATPEDIAKLVDERVNAFKDEIRNERKEENDAKAFEQSINEFISNTSDFGDYAKEIEGWLDKHPDITDIEVAYYAVKGKLSEGDAKKQSEINRAEEAKNIALNAGGGAGNSTYIPEGVDAVDALIAGRSNPNVF